MASLLYYAFYYCVCLKYSIIKKTILLSLDLTLLSSDHAPSLLPFIAKHLQRADCALSSPPSHHLPRPSGFCFHPVTDMVDRQTCARGQVQQNLPIPAMPHSAAATPLPHLNSPLPLGLHTPGLLHLLSCLFAPPPHLPGLWIMEYTGLRAWGSVLTSSFPVLSPYVILARSTV